MELDHTALLVVDVQVAFDDLDYWSPTGRRNNPDCERNVAALIAAWRSAGRPLVYIRHDSDEADSPLRPEREGNAFRDFVGGEPDLVVSKSVNSAFYGDPDLHAWLQERGIGRFAICGVTTNHCVETTTRMGGNLGYEVLFALDATHTFDRIGPDGELISADELARATAASLHGEFATVVSTAELIGAG
jgi:nicotinamidase-related amidase